MNTTASKDPKLFFPGVPGMRSVVSDDPIRCRAILFVHGCGRLNGRVADVISNFVKNEVAPASSYAFAAFFWRKSARFASARSVPPNSLLWR